MELKETLEAGSSAEKFSPIPAGWYTAVVASAEIKQTNAGNGEYIAIRFDITGPESEGRVVWANLNIRNPSPRAEEIGRQQLGELMRAIGLSTINDTDQLIGGRLEIKLSIRDDPHFGLSNNVRAFKAIKGSTLPPAVSKPVSTSTDTDTETSASSPPWAAQ
jgi:hypothetical protein